MGVEDNYYQITNLDANTTFYDWVNKENDDVIAKLNLMSIYGVSAGNGIEVVIGSTGNSFDAGDAVISLSETIPGVTVSGNLAVTGSINISDGTSATSLVTSVNGQTGAVILSLGVTGSPGPTGPAGTTPDPIFVSNNQLINGNFDIWQRGTNFSLGKLNKHFADRWTRWRFDATAIKITSSTVVRESFAVDQTDVMGSPLYYASVNSVHSGMTSSDFVGLENRIEGGDRFLGEQIYVDGYMKLSGATGATLQIYMRRNPDGSTYTIEEFADEVYVEATTWSSFFVNHTPSGSTASFTSDGYVGIGVKINDVPSGITLSLSNFRVFATQGETLESSPFREKTDIQEERRKCSRFYQRTYDLDKSAGDSTMLAGLTGAPDFTSVRFSVTPNNEYYYDFPVEMRTSPTLTLYSPSSGVVTDGFNKTAGLDMRLTSGTSGWNGNIRLHSAGQATLLTTSNEKGIIFDVNSGAVIFDDIFVHFVADSDYNA